jgi:hypothetical protein
MSDESRLAKRIRGVLDSFITPDSNERKTQQLLRISKIVDEVLRGEEE